MVQHVPHSSNKVYKLELLKPDGTEGSWFKPEFELQSVGSLACSPSVCVSFLHVLWFHATSQNHACRWFAMLNCSKVWMCVCACCPTMDWCPIHGILHLILPPPWSWPGYSSYRRWMYKLMNYYKSKESRDIFLNGSFFGKLKLNFSAMPKASDPC